MTRFTKKHLAVAAVLALGGCARQDVARTTSDGSRTASGTPESTTTRSETGTTSDMTELFQRLHHVNMMEVHAGKLAVERATNQKVREFGTKLARDHQAANERLQNLARERGISMGMPGMGPMDHERGGGRMGMGMDDEMRESMAAMERLRSLRGREFDLEFMQHMVADHEKTLAMLEGYRSTIEDRAIQQEVQQLVTTLREHRDSAQTIFAGLPGAKDRKDVRGTDPASSPIPTATPHH